MAREGVVAFFISLAALILGLAIAVFNNNLAKRSIAYYRKSFFNRSLGSDYDERPLRVQNLIAGVALTLMGIAGIMCSVLAETGTEVSSLKTIFSVGAGLILFSGIVVQIVWFGLLGKRN